MKKSCKKKERKNSLKKIFKGFTLVELLAVIVILAIIMIIAIPAVLETVESARRKTFSEYVDKVAGLSQKQLSEDQMMGTKSLTGCHIYNIKTQLGLNNTGSYEGWVLINGNENNIYVTLFDDDYVVIGYHYSDSSLKMDDYIQKKTNDNISKLTVEELCKSSSCSTCDIDGSIIDVNDLGPGSYAVTKSSTNVGKRFSGGIDFKSTPEEAMVDWQNIIGTPGATKPFYLKYVVENYIMVETYVGFVITPEMAAANDGMRAGKYYLRGGVNEEDLTDKPIFETNKATLLRAFGSSYCSTYRSDYTCRVPGLYVGALTIGRVFANDYNKYGCTIYESGSSLCDD